MALFYISILRAAVTFVSSMLLAKVLYKLNIEFIAFYFDARKKDSLQRYKVFCHQYICDLRGC